MPHATESQPDRYDFAERLEAFDRQRWSVACREMQVRLCHREILRAHEVLDAFARFTGYTQATMTSPPASVLPIRVANMVEAAGYLTMNALDHASDSQLIDEVRNLGPTAIDTIRECIGRIKRGDQLEQYEEDDELLDESCFLRRLPFNCNCHRQPTMSNPTNSDQVLAALDLIASSPDTAAEVLDARVEQLEGEVRRLKAMRKLLRSKGEPKPMPAHRKVPDVDRRKQEDEVIAYVLQHGPSTPGDIGEALGVTAITVGRIVASSDRLAKDGYKVIVVE